MMENTGTINKKKLCQESTFGFQYTLDQGHIQFCTPVY